MVDQNGRFPELRQAPVVRLDNLTKSFREGAQERHVLRSLNSSFEQGAFTAVLGRSGSGKSTLLNLISGIEQPTAGDVYVRDVAITRLSERERTLFRRDHIGFIFQFFNLIPTLTVLENVLLPQELAGRDNRAASLALLERVGLADRLDTFPDKLSGGEQQRVAIARALAHNPDLVLADEPTGNLDGATGERVLALLLDLTRDAGRSLIMVTHSRQIASRADHVLRMEEGDLVEVPPAAVLTVPAVEKR